MFFFTELLGAGGGRRPQEVGHEEARETDKGLEGGQYQGRSMKYTKSQAGGGKG